MGEVLKTQVLVRERAGWSPERREGLGRGPRSGVDVGTPCREARPSWAQVRGPGLGQPKAGGRLGLETRPVLRTLLVRGLRLGQKGKSQTEKKEARAQDDSFRGKGTRAPVLPRAGGTRPEAVEGPARFRGAQERSAPAARPRIPAPASPATSTQSSLT